MEVPREESGYDGGRQGTVSDSKTPGDWTSGYTVGNSDQPNRIASERPVPLNHSNSPVHPLPKRVATLVASFFAGAVKEEWLAAPLSFVASFPSNILTAFTVVWCAPWLAR